MDTAMTLNWLEMRRMSSARARMDDQTRMVRLARENVRLTEEIERLRDQFDLLTASSEQWIRLYEAALDRARAEAAARALLQNRLDELSRD
jgi:hypothetical protein